MEKKRIIHDLLGQTLTLWLGDPELEHSAEETADEVVLMKDAEGSIIGVELLHFRGNASEGGVAVETIVASNDG